MMGEGWGELGGEEDEVVGLLLTLRVMCLEGDDPSLTHDLDSRVQVSR